MAAPTIFSVGYEGRTLAGFVSALQEHNVQVVVDVRLNPISRKKGFSKSLLRTALALRGIAYHHEPRLGNPKHNRPPFLSGDVEYGRARFIQLMGDDGHAAIGQLTELAGASTMAILCVERESERCHRAAVTGFMTAARPEIQVVALP